MGFQLAKVWLPFSSDAFMAFEPTPGALDGIHGRVRYLRPFGV